MALLDLYRLMRRYWKMVLSITAICMLAGILASCVVPAKYEAASSITVSDPSNNVSAANMLAVVNDCVQSSIAPYAMRDSAIKASATVGTGNSAQTLTLVVEGSDAEECVALANAIVANAATDSKKVFNELQDANEANIADLRALNTSEDVANVLSGTLLQESLGSDRTFEFCTFLVNDAIEAQESSLGVVAASLVGLVGGLLVAIVALLILNTVKAPIKSCEELERISGLPLLNNGVLHDSGDQLWANVRLSSKKVLRSICLIPLGGESVDGCAISLKEAIEKTGDDADIVVVARDEPPSANVSDAIRVCKCPSMKAGVGAIYCAHESSATVICVRLWADSFRDLDSAVRELGLIGVHVTGLALLD